MKIFPIQPTLNTHKSSYCNRTQKLAVSASQQLSFRAADALLISSKSIGLNTLPRDYAHAPCIIIDKLYSFVKGAGTKAVKEVVRRSLSLSGYDGRVMLIASNPEKSPIGFYYKLGFRSTDRNINKACERWLARGGKIEDAPDGRACMYLPRENIQHCLNYPEK